MERLPAAAQGQRPNIVVERKLDELCASIDNAMSCPRPRSTDAEKRLVDEIKTKTDFLRSLLVAEGECHGDARPAYLAEAEAHFAVLETAFNQWARRGADAPAAEEEMEEQPEEEDGCSRSECSCNDSCQEAAGDAVDDADRVAVEALIDVTPDATDRKRDSLVTCEEVASDVVAKKSESQRQAVVDDASAKKRNAEHQNAAETKRSWWRRSATWCGAMVTVAVVAVGLAVEFAAVAHHNVSVYVVPT
jgi:hypothetical protein